VVKNVKDSRNLIARRPVGLHCRQECYFWMSKRHSIQGTILHKLLQRGCDIFLTRFIFSLTKGRTYQVSVGSVKLSSHNIPFGVSQGTILSPTVYNIFTLDVPSSEFCRTATFADDTTIFASGQTPLLVQDQLQDHLNEISDYCKDWKLKINASKTFLKLK
jgi:Reverse transcriptase (RNA-dependent DNA polymerase)